MIKPTECLLVMGRRGCGKSYLAKRLQDLWPRRIIIDSLGEYTEGIQVTGFSQFCDELLKLKQKNEKQFVLVFKFDPEVPVSDDLFNQILRVCFHFKNVQVVIEEIQRYSSPHYLPHWLDQCLFVGRHKGLSLLFTTQRPGMLNKGILSQCAHVFCGQLIDGNDVSYVSGFLGEHGNKLISLPERQFIYFSDKGIKQISNDF